MITSVVFGAYVKVTGAEHKSLWSPGKDGITLIAWAPHGALAFYTNKAGVTVTVFPPAGTVVVEESQAVAQWEQPKVANGPAGSPPSADPPPARPIRKGR